MTSTYRVTIQVDTGELDYERRVVEIEAEDRSDAQTRAYRQQAVFQDATGILAKQKFRVCDGRCEQRVDGDWIPADLVWLAGMYAVSGGPWPWLRAHGIRRPNVPLYPGVRP